MYDGEIKDCKEEWLGGGGISAYTASPITVNINGGKITSCIGGGSGYGSAVFVSATHSEPVTVTPSYILRTADSLTEIRQLISFSVVSVSVSEPSSFPKLTVIPSPIIVMEPTFNVWPPPKSVSVLFNF